MLKLTNREGKDSPCRSRTAKSVRFSFSERDRIILTPQEVPNILTEDVLLSRPISYHPASVLRSLGLLSSNLGQGETRQGGNTLQQLVKSCVPI